MHLMIFYLHKYPQAGNIEYHSFTLIMRIKGSNKLKNGKEGISFVRNDTCL